ncbi:MAG: adenylate kinase [Arenicella sp.]|jgi:adenylate kinase
MLNIILFGPPGAGKGTQSARLIEKYGLIHIATGDLFRKHLGEKTELGQKAKSYIDAGNLVPDSLVIDMVDDKIKEVGEVKGIIFDGFPRTVTQAEALDKLLETKQTPIKKFLALQVPEKELIERLLDRGKTSGRSDDQDISKIENRLKVYEGETIPVAKHYEQKGKMEMIKGFGEIEEIFERLSTAIDSI